MAKRKINLIFTSSWMILFQDKILYAVASNGLTGFIL